MQYFSWSEHPVCWFSPDPGQSFYEITVQNIGGKITRRAFRHFGWGIWCDHSQMRRCPPRRRRMDYAGLHLFLTQLHNMGHAHRVWKSGRETTWWAGFDVQLRGLFAGESMFYTVSNASKVAFAALIHWLDHVGNLVLDAQVLNPHTESLGAVAIPRTEYLTMLKYAQSLRVRYEGEKWVTPRRINSQDS